MTIRETLRHLEERLLEAGIESPDVEAELLLMHVLGVPRIELFTNGEQPVPDGSHRLMLELMEQRCRRIPLQHLTGSAPFHGLEFIVSSDVLIPRPETELLVEQAVMHLQRHDRSHLPVLDFATGSGCIAVALANQCPGVRMVALDVSAPALKIARENAMRCLVEDRIDFRLFNGLEALDPNEQFQSILSNPPYIPSAEIETLEPEVRLHDPRLALDGGADGLDIIRMLAAETPGHLAREGRLLLEFGHGQSAAVRKIFEAQRWIVEAILDDYSGIPRILIARRP